MTHFSIVCSVEGGCDKQIRRKDLKQVLNDFHLFLITLFYMANILEWNIDTGYDTSESQKLLAGPPKDLYMIR